MIAKLLTQINIFIILYRQLHLECNQIFKEPLQLISKALGHVMLVLRVRSPLESLNIFRLSPSGPCASYSKLLPSQLIEMTLAKGQVTALKSAARPVGKTSKNLGIEATRHVSHYIMYMCSVTKIIRSVYSSGLEHQDM